MSVRVINPASEEILAEYEFDSAAKVEQAVADSGEAFAAWRGLPLETRLECLNSFEQVLHGARVSLAERMTREMGKTLKESLAEVDKCVASCKTLRELFPKWRSSLEYSLPNGYNVSREPLGVTVGVMPWNFPLWQVLRFAIPTLLCGNSILLKHAPSTWGSAEFIEGLFTQAFPDRLYVNLKIDVPVIGQLIQDPRVRGVSITGSRQAGISVATQAGAALKKCVLELGGSDAYVVLDDADLDLAAKVCVESRVMNAGQSCVSAKRFVVTRKNVEAFTDKMKTLLAAKVTDDPLKSSTDFGPLARQDLRDQLHAQVKKSVASGAQLLLGGEMPSRKGFFYPATLLGHVEPGQAAFDEELFGPAAAVITAKDEAEALTLANRSRYGLGGAIFSRDVERARAMAIQEMDSGMVAINDFIRSDATAPFGGVKDSGLGRELGREGCFEFTNIKSVFIPPPSSGR